jgi:hypothetical protein
MKKPFLFIILALAFTCILIVYNYLGGFNEPVISYEYQQEYIIVGKAFKGKIADPAVEQLYTQMRDLKIAGSYEGPLVMVWDEEPDSEKDSVNVFIGIEIPRETSFADHLEIRKIKMNGLIRATIQGHASVMPNPSKVLEMLRSYANAHDYELQDLVIDKYLSDSVVYTEIPVKKVAP